jgi:ribosomal-protein-alanine N-acetyltransferase
MSDFPTLETDRLLLRELVADDAPALFAIHGDPPAMRWYGADPMIDVRQARRLIEIFAGWRQMPNPGVRWGIQRQSDGSLVGTCGLFKWNRGWRTCTVGYELARAARGAGLMAEALSVALAWAFEEMQLNRIEAQIHPDNAASLKLARGLGFVQEGRAREAGFWQGGHHDLLQFGLLRRDWGRA